MAAKLDQIPVPDMADSVWASIGMQLDAGGDAPDQEDDAPDLGNNMPDKKSGPGFKGKGWYGFLGAVVMVATLWWYFNHMATNRTRQAIPPMIKEPAPVADSPATIKKRDIRTAPVVQKDTVQLNRAPAIIAVPDTEARQVLPPVKVDSAAFYKDWAPVPFFDSLSVKPPARKPRGVKGISDDDYKISAEKDRH